MLINVTAVRRVRIALVARVLLYPGETSISRVTAARFRLVQLKSGAHIPYMARVEER